MFNIQLFVLQETVRLSGGNLIFISLFFFFFLQSNYRHFWCPTDKISRNSRLGEDNSEVVCFSTKCTRETTLPSVFNISKKKRKPQQRKFSMQLQPHNEWTGCSAERKSDGHSLSVCSHQRALCLSAATKHRRRAENNLTIRCLQPVPFYCNKRKQPFASCLCCLCRSNHPGIGLRDHNDWNFGSPKAQLLN